MVRAGEIEHGMLIADNAEAIWSWSSPAGRHRARRRADLIMRAVGLRSCDRVLELGCGTGLFTQKFAKAGCSIHAIDVSPALLDQAKAKTFSSPVTFGLDDAEELSFDDASFDVVIGSSVLHHLDLSIALGEIRRVLKPSGRIAFAEPNMMNPQIALQRNIPVLRRLAGESPEETAFIRWKIDQQLRDAGFRDVRIQPFDFLHPAVPKALIPMVRAFGGAFERLPGLREIAGSLIISGRRADAVDRSSLHTGVSPR